MQPSEEIKQRINIVDLVGEYVRLKKAGTNFRGLCPFHKEKTPSFMVSPSKQIWHCFGCSQGGDIFEFVKQAEGMEFRDALRLLADRAGVILQKPSVSYKQQTDKKNLLLDINELAAKYYQKVLSDSPAAEGARKYLRKRGFREETIKKWRLGYSPDNFHTFENFIVKKGYQKNEAAEAGLLVKKDDPTSTRFSGEAGGTYFDRFRGRIMFPLFDEHGRVVGFTARFIEASRPDLASGHIQPKYINSPETPVYSKSRLIYGLNFAKNSIRREGKAVIVEGNADVITCHEFNFENAAGSSGTALTEQQLALIKRFAGTLVFAFDVDQAGLAATRRAVELALAGGFEVKIMSIPSDIAKDPDEFIRKDKAMWEERLGTALNFMDFYFERIFATLDTSNAAAKKKAVAEFIPLLALLPDALERIHYVQKMAISLSVDENTILEFLNKILAARRQQHIRNSAEQPREKRPDRTAALEMRVLGLLLKFSRELEEHWQGIDAEFFTDPKHRQIAGKAKEYMENGALDIERFREANLELSGEIDLLILGIENEFAMSPDWNLEMASRELLQSLRLQKIKQKMAEIAGKIRTAESAGRQEDLKILTGEFNSLTRELGKIHGR